MEFRALKKEELTQWVEHTGQVFAETGPEYFLRHIENDPSTDFEGIFVAVESGVIASTLRVFTRKMYLCGCAVDFGGIGEVSTKDEFRRQGLSGKLLHMAIDYMNRKNMPISMLFTGTNRHYARYGWMTVPNRQINVDLSNIVGLAEDYALRPVEEGDWAAIRGIYELYSSGLDGVILRDHPDYWAQWIRSEVKAPYALVKGGELVAYLDFEANEKRIAIREFGQKPDVDILLPAFKQLALQQNLVERLLVPEALLPGCVSANYSESLGTMVRLNHAFTLGGQRIESGADLVRAFAQLTWWSADGF